MDNLLYGRFLRQRYRHCQSEREHLKLMLVRWLTERVCHQRHPTPLPSKWLILLKKHLCSRGQRVSPIAERRHTGIEDSEDTWVLRFPSVPPVPLSL